MEIVKIDKKKILENKNNKYKEEKMEHDIKTFNKKFKLKNTLLNIDSKFRNKIPKNIVKSGSFLSSDPITLTKDSNLVKIYYKNHNLKVGDKVTVQNVTAPIKTLSNAISFISGFSYAALYFPNHGITSDYLSYVDDIRVKIELVETLEFKDRLIGNIPINSILDSNIIYHSSLISNIPDSLYTNLGVDSNTFSTNYLFIELPYNYSVKINDIDKTVENTVLTSFYTIDKIFKISFLNLGGIPLTYLNANYPINYQQFVGFQEINKIEDNYIYFNSKIKAFTDITGGGDKVVISYIINTLPGYPNSNEYTIPLKKNFNNVVKIELVSCEVFFIDFLVKNGINNKFYWKHLDDGDKIYSIEIPEGNYHIDVLLDKIKELFNQVERITSSNENKIYNILEINSNLNRTVIYQQEIEFVSFSQDSLPESITFETININDETFYKLIIKHPNNFVEVGDSITISGCNNIDLIPSSSINKSHIVFEVNKNVDTYSVILERFNLESSSTAGQGGNGIKIKTRSKIQFLFNYKDSIGKVLGFKYVGQENAVTRYSHKIKNTDKYLYPSVFNEVGNPTDNSSILNSFGENNYMLLYLNDYEAIISNSDVPSCFAKILLCNKPGEREINSHVRFTYEFENPLSTLSELRIKFTFGDGTLVNFNNINNSFTLKIVEEVSYSRNTNLIS